MFAKPTITAPILAALLLAGAPVISRAETTAAMALRQQQMSDGAIPSAVQAMPKEETAVK